LESLQEVADLINSKMRQTVPRRPPSVLVFGPPGAGRTTLGKAVARKYGMTFIATSEIIAHDIAQGGERIALGQVAKGEAVPDMVMLRLLNERLARVDCRMRGYVLDGFPKTPMQFDFLG
jgi:adenylate kinase